MPAPDAQLTGSCACGAVRYEVTAPFSTAGYCHCHRCQRRSGALWTLNAIVAADGFAIVEGAGDVRTWCPADGLPKSFCATCGGHIFSGDRDTQPTVGVRLGTVHGDPGIAPRWRQWIESAPGWEAIPQDGLPRFPQRREVD